MSPAAPRIDILLTGSTLPAIRAKYSDFERWFQERSGSTASYRVHSVYNGAPVPAADDSDGWIITGASDSVNDAHSWLSNLKMEIKQATTDGHPILGVCFGHQLLAASCGGQVRMNPKGWELGTTAVDLTPAGAASPLFAGIETPIWVYQTHQETVTELPSKAKILAVNEMGIQAFQVGDRAFGVQFHPEFTYDIAKMYVELRTGKNNSGCELLREEVVTSRKVLTNYIQLITA